MSTPQNPNDPNSNPSEQTLDGQNSAAGDQPKDPQSAQPTYQQGTYDPNAYQAQGQQYAQPGAYQQGAYSQDASRQQAYGQPAYGQPAYGQPPQSNPQQSGFFKSLFDIRFDNFIAVKWAGFIYIIAIVVAVLSYLGTIVAGITTGIAAGATSGYFNDGPSFSVLPLILSIVFGWIIPALWVIGVRLVLELIVSNIKTAEHTQRIADSVSR